jgi:ABC-type bacteriocin/lantibiotic exporter with double-glycine peptidase domain
VKPVVQREPTGCGIASVAAIAGLSYAQARSIAAALGIRAADRALWSGTVHVRTLLRHTGFAASPREHPFRSWSALPDLALLSIKWHLEQGRPFWHWVVFVREGGRACVLDPKKGLRRNRRTDFGRMKPKWFIPVTASRNRRSAATGKEGGRRCE